MEGDPLGILNDTRVKAAFQSTPSAWRETQRFIFNKVNGSFQSTPSAWRETIFDAVPETGKRFQSTPSAWRETFRGVDIGLYPGNISIHSLRMEGDKVLFVEFVSLKHFNPLPPHGGRHKMELFASSDAAFQSTPSAWRETRWWNRNCPVSVISIHSLRMEGDIFNFNNSGRRNIISIHSLRMEGDVYRIVSDSANECYFNPLPPHGGRPFDSCRVYQVGMIFQSTPSAWRETPLGHNSGRGDVFQSTPSAWRETRYALRE